MWIARIQVSLATNLKNASQQRTIPQKFSCVETETQILECKERIGDNSCRNDHTVICTKGTLVWYWMECPEPNRKVAQVYFSPPQIIWRREGCIL